MTLTTESRGKPLAGEARKVLPGIVASAVFDVMTATRTASRMPFIFAHLALMPDAHLGKGATVGSVIPTLGAIIPAAVGVDIGRGMMAVESGRVIHRLAGRKRTTVTLRTWSSAGAS